MMSNQTADLSAKYDGFFQEDCVNFTKNKINKENFTQTSFFKKKTKKKPRKTKKMY